MKKRSLIPLYRSAILTWLRETRPQSPAAIEDYIRRRFHERWTARDRKVNRKGIPQWQNDVHWARAHLTRQGLTVNGAGKVAAVEESAVKPRVRPTKPVNEKSRKRASIPLFDSLTAEVLAALRQGNPPWRKLWGDLRRPKKHIDFAPLALPTNCETGRPYTGMNTIALWNATRKLLLAESRWGTALAWWRLNAQVKPDAQFTLIRYFVRVDGPGDEEETRPIWHRLYNLAQVNGCDHLREQRHPERRIRTEGEIDTSRALEFIRKCGARVRWGGEEASYNWKTDLIRMPHKQRFRSKLDIITVLFHELGHWRGHDGRLKRQLSGDKESPEYAFEELVAELTACFLLAYLKIPDRFEVCQHAGYIKGYIRLLENDPKALRRAAALAGKAARYLLDLFESSPVQVPRKLRHRGENQAAPQPCAKKAQFVVEEPPARSSRR